VIDLHCHILPGIDDGPPHEEDSLALGRALAAGGCQIVAATPHLREDHPGVRVEEIAERCEGLNEALAAASIALLVVPAGEVDVLWARGASDEQLRLATYGQLGADLLLETPYGPLPDAFEDVVGGLRARGLRVLLGHPERNPTFQRDPARLARLVSDGVLVQVTAQSLIDEGRRSASRELAVALVEQGLAHVIASDSHSAGRFRPPNLADGVLAAARIAPERATWMAVDAPLAVLAGKPLHRSNGNGSEARGRRPPRRALSRFGFSE
jgi:protein-tyrosine phosphatase